MSDRSPVVRERLPFLLGATAATAAVSLFMIPWLAFGTGALALLVFWFFRDPERTPPSGPGLILSPADGRTVSIIETREDRFMKDRAIRVSIFLSVLDVHVNRIPVSGWIRGMAYQPGRFLMAQAERASSENEQNAVFLETVSGKKIVFVQIAGFIARRIVCWAGIGKPVESGERFGMIRFGSRMDLYLPVATKLRVKVGDRVRGGSTVIGELP